MGIEMKLWKATGSVTYWVAAESREMVSDLIRTEAQNAGFDGAELDDEIASFTVERVTKKDAEKTNCKGEPDMSMWAAFCASVTDGVAPILLACSEWP